MPSPVIVIAIGGVLVLILIIVRLGSRKPGESLQARLAEYSLREQPATLEEIELSLPFAERVIAPMVRQSTQFMLRFTPAKTLETTRRNLDLAGNPNNWGPSEFFGIRALATGVLGVLIFVLLTITQADLPIRLLMASVFAAIGFFLPVFWLGSKIRGRKANVIKALPDALDLLTICVEAGLGFDQAVQKVSEKWDNELSRAFGRMLQEIRLGKTRREALRDMSSRIDVNDMTSFIAAVIQSEQLGVSMAKVLRIQSDQMRVRRRQRAEEKARQAPVKMLFPLVFLIFPSIFIVLLGPAVLQLMSTSNPVTGG
ncbi:MAG TPA: type II secretion system F family protein [Anaerolineae bacterium]|nr:type II secretion system F family protein [Anaerolineae bacterium]